MRYLILLSLLMTISIASCNRDDNSLNSNAEIIAFNPDKCICCWGWTIKMGNDTIKSDNAIIGEVVGFDINRPIKVYIELGEIEDTCSNMGFMSPERSRDYYHIKRIEKIE